MAVLGQVSNASAILGDALKFANSFTQPQVSISEKKYISNLKFPVPTIGINTVVLEIVDTEDMTLGVNITDKPVADLGAAIDFISRKPPEFSLVGLLSKRNLDILSDPLGFGLSQAASAAPQVAAAIGQVGETLENFVDLGGDEIDNKIKQFYIWMNNAIPVYPLGVKLNINNWLQDIDIINWFIRDVRLSHSLDTGDGAGIEIDFYGVLGHAFEKATTIGTILQDVKSYTKSLGGLNPFGGV